MRILLLAGGAGTRLWPLSSERRPKQFLPLVSEKSLIADTYERVRPLTEDIWVAAAERHADLVRSELPSLSATRILTEPARRNSGPAMLAAALRFQAEGDPVTAALPSDQTVADEAAFRDALSAAGRAADDASVVVLAVPPSRADTDFGYVELGAPSGGAFDVRRFVEKPRRGEAEQYLSAGLHWNAGIFVFRPSRLLAEARRVAGDLVSSVERYRELVAEGRVEAAGEAYRSLPAISIDYAVMEKISGARAVILSAGWSDVGTWRAVRQVRGASDERGNLILSDAPVLAPGVENTAIVVSREGVLVVPFEREGEVREAVEGLWREEAGPSPALKGTTHR